jgi:tetratricopeptide (TPR) repeat protein
MEGMMFRMTRTMGAPARTHDRQLEQAQQLMYRAWEERNPAKRIALAHDALAASPNCADAHVLLAEEEAPTVEKALEYYRKGVAAGERALGPEYFAENAGAFWGLLETRPYMRARLGLADALWRLLQTDEAIAHFREMLRLNPGDNQGVRYLLLNLLMRLERDAEVGALLAQYDDDAMAAWLYSRALHEFRTAGASERANEALRAALKENQHVPAYLMGEKRIPHALPQTIGFGDEHEAIAYAHDHINNWRRTAGALDWLKSQMARQPAGTQKRAVRKRGRTRK